MSRRKDKKATAAVAEQAKVPPEVVVGVGGSAGGLEAFLELLLALPRECPFALVVVIHGDAHRPSALRDVIARNTGLPVVSAEDGMLLERSHVYVIPARVDAGVSKGRLVLTAPPLHEHPCPSIDHFFESLAEASAPAAIGVLLSGTGNDGTRGLVAIRAAGGATLCQEPKSARFPMLPDNAIESGVVDFVLPPHLLASELTSLTRHPFVVALHQSRFGRTHVHDTDQLERIIKLLRGRTEVDFSSYKQTTVLRRIRRRMGLHDLSDLLAYADLLAQRPQELDALYTDLLINVTYFFREPESYKVLQETVFPAIFKTHAAGETLRIWVPGCSSGEQVYSLGIALVESMRTRGQHFDVQMFGTDISVPALMLARAGHYPASIAEQVSGERLQAFFQRSGDGYHICKQVREMCVFARQNLLVDPPFSRLDLIVCTNLLIYLDGAAQRKLIPLFHYALRPGGFLQLGVSESVGAPSNLFSLLDKRQKLYAKRPALTAIEIDFARSRPVVPENHKPEGVGSMNRGVDEAEFDPAREADRLLLARYAPAAVVVNAEMEIVQFRGRTGLFLEPASGPATHNLFKMAREGLVADLRAGTLRAREDGVVCRREGIRVRVNDAFVKVALEVVPIRPRGRDVYYLVTFEASPEESRPPSVPKTRRKKTDEEVERLQRALDETQGDLQTIIEEKEAANEELKAANEEIQSSNEELQSTNEELQTVKEEIQSANEELSTINDELQTRNYELNTANNDLSNLLSNVTIPLVMLGQDLRIRRFTPMAEKLFNMIPGDVGRPITDINLNLQVENLTGIVHEVLEDLTAREVRLTDKRGHWYSMRVRPYRTAERKVDGVVLALFEVDELRQTLDRERETAAMLEVLLHECTSALLFFREDGGVLHATRAIAARLGVDEERLRSERAFDLPLLGPAIGQYLAQAAARVDTTVEVAVDSGRICMWRVPGWQSTHAARLEPT